MARIRDDQQRTSLASRVRFALDEHAKSIYTAMPGIVTAFDADTARASVRGALYLIDTDERQHQRPIIEDVPVLYPRGGGYRMTFPLAEGDDVLLIFSMRGLSAWKRALGEARPDVGAVLDGDHVVCVPGFAVGEIAEEAMVLGNDDTTISIGASGVTITGDVTIIGSFTRRDPPPE